LDKNSEQESKKKMMLKKWLRIKRNRTNSCLILL